MQVCFQDLQIVVFAEILLIYPNMSCINEEFAFYLFIFSCVGVR